MIVITHGPLHWHLTAAALWEALSLNRRAATFLQAYIESQKLVVEAMP